MEEEEKQKPEKKITNTTMVLFIVGCLVFLSFFLGGMYCLFKLFNGGATLLDWLDASWKACVYFLIPGCAILLLWEKLFHMDGNLVVVPFFVYIGVKATGAVVIFRSTTVGALVCAAASIALMKVITKQDVKSE